MANTIDAVFPEYETIHRRRGKDYATQCISGDPRLTDDEKKTLLKKLGGK